MKCHHQARECIGTFIFLPRYVLDRHRVEFGHDVTDDVVVSLEEGFFDFELSFDLADDQLGVALACDLSRA